MDIVFFYAFGAIALGGGLLTISLRNPVHCAIGLLISLLGAAGIFLQTRAEFLFAAQLVVYAGGVVLLFLFVIMLVNLDQIRVERRWTEWWPAGAGGSSGSRGGTGFVVECKRAASGRGRDAGAEYGSCCGAVVH